MARFDCDLSCFKRLRQEMYEISYSMYPFFFHYNSIHTFAALYVITKEERDLDPKMKYVLFHLIFMKEDDLDESIECYINSQGICEYNHKLFREFFEIQDNPNAFGNFMGGLCAALVRQCPPHATSIGDPRLLQAERHSLCRKLNLDPDRCYPLKIMRLGEGLNGKQKYRDPNKYQLALRLMPHAAKLYEKEKRITYCFTDDETKAVEESVAIKRFTKKELSRHVEKR